MTLHPYNDGRCVFQEMILQTKELLSLGVEVCGLQTHLCFWKKKPRRLGSVDHHLELGHGKKAENQSSGPLEAVL